MKEFVLLNCWSDVVVPYNKTRYGTTESFECLLVSPLDFFGKNEKTFSDLSQAKEFYGDYVFYDRNDLKKEPKREGELICVYSSDVSLIKTDPYFWKYPAIFYEYWNTIDWEVYVSKNFELLEQIKKFRIYGADYYIFKNCKNRYIVCSDVDPEPDLMIIEEKFESFEDAIDYVRSAWSKESR